MANKWVYTFKEGNMTMRNLLGGKGANLAEMTEIGLPVPQGFTITTEACTQYYEDGRKINDEIMAQTMEGVKWMEEVNGKKFGDQLGKCCCVFPLAPVYQFQCLFLIYHCLFILVYYMIRMKMFLVVCESSNI